jgi:Na+/H+ antiporter NhaD/arsenite permease-like protein
MKGEVVRPIKNEEQEHYTNPTTSFERNLIFFLGVAGLIFVPIFKTITHLPPFMGMMLSLGILWAVTEIIHKSKNHEDKSQLSVLGVLRKVDTASVLFFLGILLAVSGLQSSGQLAIVALNLNEWFGGDVYAINIVIGLLSSIVDNVPLVAGSMGMYEISSTGDFAVDGKFWQFLAYCAGTGGSALIIGSAAGVAVMGLEKIDFVWYVKKISFLALLGYFAGAGSYIFLQSL